MAKKRMKTNFGRRVAEAIERSGTNCNAVAVKCGISAPYLYQIAGGRQDRAEGAGVDRAVALAKKLASAIGCPVEELLGL